MIYQDFPILLCAPATYRPARWKFRFRANDDIWPHHAISPCASHCSCNFAQKQKGTRCCEVRTKECKQVFNKRKKTWFQINYSAQFDIHSHSAIIFNLFHFGNWVTMTTTHSAKFIICLYLNGSCMNLLLLFATNTRTHHNNNVIMVTTHLPCEIY